MFRLSFCTPQGVNSFELYTVIRWWINFTISISIWMFGWLYTIIEDLIDISVQDIALRYCQNQPIHVLVTNIYR